MNCKKRISMLIFIIFIFSSISFANVFADVENSLLMDSQLNVNESIFSPNGNYSLTLKNDGNLVLSKIDSTIVWSSKTSGNTDSYYLKLQNDGSLVINNSQNQTIWSSKTTGILAPAKLLVEDTGKLTIRNSSGKIVWDTLTGIRSKWPASGTNNSNISSGFGYRIHPVLLKIKYHTGIDIAADFDTDIVAARSGTVISAGDSSDFGNRIVLDHGNGLKTTYNHCNSFIAEIGDLVNRGDVIAKVGSTGLSTGPHLHFEVISNGSFINPMNYGYEY